MASKIYVENLPADLTEQGLKDIFAQIGDVQAVKIETDLLTKRSKGRGVVEMSLDVDAYRAVNCFEGATIKDRKIHLKEAKPLLERAKNIFAHGIALQGMSLGRSKEKHDH